MHSPGFRGLFQLVQLPSVRSSTRSRVCQTRSALLWSSSVLDDNAAACQLRCDRAPHAGKPCGRLQAGVLLGEGTVWDHTKSLLQKQFMGRTVLSVVWMGLLAWFRFPMVGIKDCFPGIASSVQGVFLVYCGGICVPARHSCRKSPMRLL